MNAPHGRINLQKSLIRISLISIASLIPCFWQSRIQAGDLSSHIYNACLTNQVQGGFVSGFWIAHQHTNIALDLLLGWLVPKTGVYVAQHIAIPLFVLIFFWGVVRFTRAVARTISWPTIAFAALLTYGYVFHLGLFNFYFSVGICCWFLGLTWGLGVKRTLLTSPLLIVAWTGNPLPVLWAMGSLFYKIFAEKTSARLVFGMSILALVGARIVMSHIYLSQWNSTQLSLITGADQVFLYGIRYIAIMVLLLFIWACMLREQIHADGWHGVITNPATQLYFLTALTVVIFPDAVLFNIHQAPATFLTERLSLFCGILLCAVVGKNSPSFLNQALLAAVIVLFFLFCYQDSYKLNLQEDQLTACVSQLSPANRAVFIPKKEASRLPPPTHMIDRACIEHCLSYANYEPTSGHFRLRAESNVALGDYWTLQSLQQGNYFVKARDLPLDQIVPTGDGMTYKIIQLRKDQRITSLGPTN